MEIEEREGLFGSVESSMVWYGIVWLMMMMRLGWRSRAESELELESGSVDDSGDGMREGERRGEREVKES